MWLATPYGFYSVMKRNKLQIRAFDKQDLKNLKALCGLSNIIWSWKKADYPYRIFVSQAEFTRVMNLLSYTVDYDNFKSRVKNTIDQKDKYAAYLSCHTSLKYREWKSVLDSATEYVAARNNTPEENLAYIDGEFVEVSQVPASATVIHPYKKAEFKYRPALSGREMKKLDALLNKK